MELSRELVDEIVSHAREESPNECCGMVAGKDGRATRVFRARNAEASPLRYGLDPTDQFRIIKEIEGADEELAAIYHSHTGSAAYPSQTDVNLAFHPDSIYLIVSLEDESKPDVRAFRIKDEEITEVQLTYAD